MNDGSGRSDLAHGQDCGCTRCTGFQKGNTFGVTHGAHGIVLLRPRAQEIRGELVQVAPCATPADGPMFDVAAMVLAQAERSQLVLEAAQHAEIDALRRGESLDPVQRQTLARLSADVRGWMNSAMRALDRLGCSTLARSQLGLNVVRAQVEAEQGLAELRERGREIVEARERESDGR